MSITDDLDPDVLISRLARPLSPADRIAFRRAAEDALSRVPCWGEGAVYRAVASLQRAFFDPPTECRAHWDIEREVSQASKLKAAPAIEYPGGAQQRLIDLVPSQREAVRRQAFTAWLNLRASPIHGAPLSCMPVTPPLFPGCLFLWVIRAPLRPIRGCPRRSSRIAFS